ncbi:Ydr279p protein family (RNase H2 complex component) [Trypanosoma brucei equiperdum]|uniref:Ydr279p protein family (RNase H2 complex component) n=1 Tax=Trypanosoma brucei equiperdum TaxID=630700 RepID=A0A3L6LG15_9TRYP|nr:Ydr279p protein family (RNase H2 complex component) [Trypanosoma brucei equiperdum]
MEWSRLTLLNRICHFLLLFFSSPHCLLSAMRAVKRNRQPSLQQPDGKTSAVAAPGRSEPPSSCSSDVGSPRRKLELDDEGSQSLLSNPSQPVASGGAVRYDVSDRTTPLPAGAHSSHMIVLPRSLLNYPLESVGGIPVGNGGLGGEHTNSINEVSNDGGMESLRSSGTLFPAASVGVSPGAGMQLCGPTFREVAVASVRKGCDFVRLPHPRHGEPALFLCPPATGEGENSDCSTHGAVLYEVQAQSPAEGFGQTWLVGELVEPNENLLIVTPFDCTFLALRQVSAHTMKDKFLPAEDLITGPVRSGACDSTWPGWGVALAQCPALAPAVQAMQSHTVLSRICDVKSVGDDSYYRFSTAKMGIWLKNKVKRAMASPGLRSLLELDKSGAENSDGGATEVPISVAFGVVAEYIPQDLCSTAAELCGTAET